jgi:hypothetical protein
MRIHYLVTFALVMICLSERATTQAQDFAVATKVCDLSHGERLERARSLTLFHAGKTYDFIHEVGELIIFEPARDRMTLLNTAQRRATEVHLDEIKRMLQSAREAVNDHLELIKGSDKPGSQALIEELLFQIDPRFNEEKLTPLKNGEARLTLNSRHFRYQVECAAPPTPEHADVYLKYADWICRLNYVLHPGSLLPDQRIVLNASLRAAKLIPVQVTFVGTIGEPIHLEAQHRIFWELNAQDRELIRQWDALLARRDFKRVSFQDYQRALLLSQASKRR